MENKHETTVLFEDKPSPCLHFPGKEWSKHKKVLVFGRNSFQTDLLYDGQAILSLGQNFLATIKLFLYMTSLQKKEFLTKKSKKQLRLITIISFSTLWSSNSCLHRPYYTIIFYILVYNFTIK